MPTVGWIQESALDRFLTGTTTTPDPGPPPPPRFFCPFCASSYGTPPLLTDHLAASHRASRPHLSFAGIEPASDDVIRASLAASSVHLFNVTGARLSRDGGRNFRPVLPNEVPQIVAATTSGRLRLRLENCFEAKAIPVSQDYDLTFKVYSDAQLDAVDRKFVTSLARPDPTIALVDAFMEEAAHDGANEYSEALGSYVLGVLIKDADPASGVRSGIRDHRRKLNSSLRALKDFERPLARLISALIRFSSNDFSNIYRTGLNRLDHANGCLVPLTRFGVAKDWAASWNSAGGNVSDVRVAVTPLDNGSDSIIRWADQLSSIVRWSDGVEDALRAEAGAASCDPLDRAKLCALWASAANRLGQHKAASEPLHLLAGNDCFGRWADVLSEENDG